MVFYLLLVISFSSCGPLVKLTLGIESPEYKSDEDVKKYADKKLISDLAIYRMSELSRDDDFVLGVSSLPKLLYVSNEEIKNLGSTCPANVNSWIEAPIEALNGLPKLRDASQEEVERSLYLLSGEQKAVSTDQPTFYIFYANYIGSMNKKKVYPWIEVLENRSDVNYILINCDINVPLEPGQKKEKITFKVNKS